MNILSHKGLTQLPAPRDLHLNKGVRRRIAQIALETLAYARSSHDHNIFKARVWKVLQITVKSG